MLGHTRPGVGQTPKIEELKKSASKIEFEIEKTRKVSIEIEIENRKKLEKSASKSKSKLRNRKSKLPNRNPNRNRESNSKRNRKQYQSRWLDESFRSICGITPLLSFNLWKKTRFCHNKTQNSSENNEHQCTHKTRNQPGIVDNNYTACGSKLCLQTNVTVWTIHWQYKRKLIVQREVSFVHWTISFHALFFRYATTSPSHCSFTPFGTAILVCSFRRLSLWLHSAWCTSVKSVLVSYSVQFRPL